MTAHGWPLLTWSYLARPPPLQESRSSKAPWPSAMPSLHPAPGQITLIEQLIFLAQGAPGCSRRQAYFTQGTQIKRALRFLHQCTLCLRIQGAQTLCSRSIVCAKRITYRVVPYRRVPKSTGRHTHMVIVGALEPLAAVDLLRERRVQPENRRLACIQDVCCSFHLRTMAGAPGCGRCP